MADDRLVQIVAEQVERLIDAVLDGQDAGAVAFNLGDEARKFLDAIRAAGGVITFPAEDGEVERLRAEVESRGRIIDALRAAIRDIDSHATSFGEDEHGFVAGGYLISVGSLHRALALSNGTGVPCPKCKASSHDCDVDTERRGYERCTADVVAKLSSLAIFWRRSEDYSAALTLAVGVVERGEHEGAAGKEQNDG